MGSLWQYWQDKRKGRVWLIQSKTPSCFQKYLSFLPENTYLLTTLETNRDEGYEKISKAPKPSERYLFHGIEEFTTVHNAFLDKFFT